MFDALYIAATGMHAQQSQLDTISNNLANMNTPGFKKSRVEFDDLLYRHAINGNSTLGSATGSLSQGMGTSVASINKVFSVGDLKKTQNALDFAIDGQGFFEVLMDNGELAYTRTGRMQVNEEGLLSTIDGLVLSNSIRIPVDAKSVVVSNDGVVQVTLDDDEIIEAGRMELADFVNPGGLSAIGDNLYAATEKSGIAFYGNPGDETIGNVVQGHLETSNVDLVEELLELTIAQRAYEVNSKVISAMDEVMRINNNLRR